MSVMMHMAVLMLVVVMVLLVMALMVLPTDKCITCADPAGKVGTGSGHPDVAAFAAVDLLPAPQNGRECAGRCTDGGITGSHIM